MPSKRETILARVITALAGTTGVGTRIYRSRVEAMARAETPAIVVEPIADNATQDTVATLSWSLVFRVSIFTRGQVPDQIADDTAVSVHSKLMGDTTLGGLVTELIATAVDFQLLDADQPAGITSLQFTATYRTQLNSIT